MISCGVVGATGYAGAELARLLVSHPEVEAVSLGSSSSVGEEMERLYPNLGGAYPSVRLVDRAAVIEQSEVVFSSLPHGHAEEIAAECAAAGKLFIDLSADFRFGTDGSTYATWYGREYTHPELHASSVYGLPELNRERIAGARLIGNPGCYPTASTLGLFPAMRLGYAALDGVIIDAKSGVTGAGREPTRSTHYAEVADSIVPYKIGSHRHTPEIAIVLSEMAKAPVSAIFTPHLAPMGRGIVATIYFRLAQKVETEKLRDAYAEFYAKEPFVRVLAEGMVATNRNVRFSNYCDISVHLGSDGRTAIVVSAIDNMVKGAAGQAIQNMNIALGFDERAGIGMMPPAF